MFNSDPTAERSVATAAKSRRHSWVHNLFSHLKNLCFSNWQLTCLPLPLPPKKQASIFETRWPGSRKKLIKN
jgi:hypothetical protein